MLTLESVVPYLIERGLIDPNWIIDGELRISSSARRNRNFKVEGPSGKGFLLKQPDDPMEGGHETLRREQTFRRFCRECSQAGPLAPLLPRLIESDRQEARSVYELIPDVTSIWSLLDAQNGEPALTEAVRSVGQALGTVHRVFRLSGWEDDSYPHGLSRQLPWALTFPRPEPWLLAHMSAANHQTWRILQGEDGLDDRLQALCRLWQPETLIHGDVRFDNFLFRRPPTDLQSAPIEVWLVDWEMVQIGDPAWDLAGALQDFLVFWIASMPLSAERSVEQSIDQSRVRLADLQAAIRELWTGYQAGAGMSGGERGSFLGRAVAYSAARLFQSVHEMSQPEDELPGQAVILLQLGANLMADPERGQVQLYGIPNAFRP
jgi:Ser/Thr protein kinase RdoA (MazF antagonist)